MYPNKKEAHCIYVKWFPDFFFEGGNSQFYAFRRNNSDEIYDHIILQKELYENTLRLAITEVASCYNQSWKGIPSAVVGYSTDIAVLITGNHHYKVGTGWHECENKAEELEGLLDEIRKDIDTYVFNYFIKNHEKINADQRLVTINSYMQSQFKLLSENDIQAIKEYLIDVNKTYGAYRKSCMKNKEKETTRYFDIIPLHPIVECWLNDLSDRLNYSHFSDSTRHQIITQTTVLFRDNYNFYDLKL